MAATRRTVLAIGLLLLVAGLFVMNQGNETVYPFAEVLGLVSHVPSETTLMPPTLVAVAPANYTSFSIDLEGGVQVKGVLTVSGGREIAFYVMNEASFFDWRAGRPSTIILSKPFTNSYNFSLTPPSTGTYYFVFDNEETSRKVVVFGLDVVRDKVVLSILIEYLGPELLLIGILLAIIGFRTGKKKPEPEAAPVTTWRCKFCGYNNPLSETFCKKCGRAKE